MHLNLRKLTPVVGPLFELFLPSAPLEWHK